MFGRGVKLFKLFGFEVRIDWSWIFIVLLVTWTLALGFFPAYVKGLTVGEYWWMGLAGAIGLFLCIVLHELGHSMVARRFGIPMKEITLFIFGGVAEMDDEPPSPKAEILMTLAGPAVTLVLAAASFGIARLGEIAGWPAPVLAIFVYLTWINFVLLAFNLLPAFPLDGGRVLRSILWAWKKNIRWATRVAAAIGSSFAFLLGAWGIVGMLSGSFVQGMWWVVLAIFLYSASRQSYQQLLLRQALEGEPVRKFMTANPVTVPPSASVKEVVDDYVYKYHHKMFPVVGDGHLVGLLGVDQLKQLPSQEWDRHTAQEMAAPLSPQNTVGPDDDATKALSTMARSQISRLLVVDNGQLIGIVALKDLLKFFALKIELETT